jgi:hypothetical protein
MRLVKLSLPHVLAVVWNLRASDRQEAFADRWDDDPDSLAVEIARGWGKLGWVAMHEGRPVAVFGATEKWPGVWSCWLLATDEWPKVALGVTKFVKRRIMPYLVETGAIRCEARSIDGHTKSHRWLAAIGCVQEARLRRYGRNGEDFLVFRWDPHVQQD